MSKTGVVEIIVKLETEDLGILYDLTMRYTSEDEIPDIHRTIRRLIRSEWSKLSRQEITKPLN